ncbi:gamma-glutamyl-gamma-aminobutyrate hydrolase family protein [Gulosibacter chungangensis]|uniref:Gamma-glutamyl-gamma-aminobutyrate hydrolase family protein n=2 Tax=Gulosibacter chungangensis TaxID=979746 RepID=A0A7J5B7N1_9MICO|nr:gamma-glutamyl-gamma-aminobutyrate hydrolase family protein [Gulosibacter chungangensis]
MASAQIRGLRFSGTVVANAVLESIVRAGGEPVIVSPVAESGIWDRVDGIVLPGGSDINPARYGAEPDETHAGTDFDIQDDADARAIAAAESRGLPALLICRGMQLWNVERGGTMIQHWPSDQQEHVGTVHAVEVDAESRLAAALADAAPAPAPAAAAAAELPTAELPAAELSAAESVTVSSYHHQAVGELGRGLRVVARASDGCVEALEDPSLNIVAVQWHPEDRAETLAVDQVLFDWVVQQAAEFRAAKAQRAGSTQRTGSAPVARPAADAVSAPEAGSAPAADSAADAGSASAAEPAQKEDINVATV